MKPSLRHVIALLALLLPVALRAQNSPTLTVAPVSTLVVERGGSAPLRLHLRVNQGFHINSSHPDDELLLPTVLHLSPQDGIVITEIHYPMGERLVLPSMEEKLNVYSGDFEITAKVGAERNAGLGLQAVHGQVRYQACDNRQCFPPKSVPLQFDVKVVTPKKKK